MPAYRTSRARLLQEAKGRGLGSLVKAARAAGFTAPWFAVNGEYAYVLEPEPVDPIPEGWEEVPEETVLALIGG
ncbi:hypothetical protein TthSNM66_18310 [Thermus thermophilus]|uniref:hypothetical protein n=1 Tax=Thermus thermophilus TaxID=274 RepID=UPI001FCB58B4|nr:hypothetical protein [Thermus thermophilus]BDG27195.1 hypothetical protein TthSNM66_18310 [Thermus thermophilus]